MAAGMACKPRPAQSIVPSCRLQSHLSGQTHVAAAVEKKTAGSTANNTTSFPFCIIRFVLPTLSATWKLFTPYAKPQHTDKGLLYSSAHA